MNSRDHFPDEELRRRIMDFIMAAGQRLDLAVWSEFPKQV